jgi:hypothetical protein
MSKITTEVLRVHFFSSASTDRRNERLRPDMLEEFSHAFGELAESN